MKINIKDHTITIPAESIRDYTVKVYIDPFDEVQKVRPKTKDEYKYDLARKLFDLIIKEEMVTFDERPIPDHVGAVMSASISILSFKKQSCEE